MKPRFQLYLILSVVSLFLFTFFGCYTQLGTTREDGQDEYGSTQYNNDTSAAGGYDSGNYEDQRSSGYNGYNDDEWDSWHHRAQLGFSFYTPSYYWPSYAFGAAYNDPWFYDCYWSYDPWRCGNSYYGGYSYYGNSYYGYSPYYYSSYYPYYPPMSYRYVYTTPGQRGSRDFGSTRGVGSTRGGVDVRNDGNGYSTDRSGYNVDRGGYNLPGAARLNGSTSGGVTNTNNSAPRSNGRDVGTQRAASPRSNDRSSSGRAPDVRAWGSRGGSTRGDAGRQPNNGDGNTSFTPPPTSAAPTRSGGSKGDSHSTPRREPSRGGRDSGSNRGGNPQPSYTPPPPPPQQQSSPPPSSAPANTGSRGGSTRGGRP